jgi:hypothetical protein
VWRLHWQGSGFGRLRLAATLGAIAATALITAPAHADVTTNVGGVSYVSMGASAPGSPTNVTGGTETCPQGTRLLSGGESNNAGFDSINLAFSSPADGVEDQDTKPDDFWRVGVVAHAQHSFTPWAVCAKLKVRYVVKTVNLPPTSQSPEKIAKCPAGTHVISGGVHRDGSVNLGIFINSTRPVDLGDANHKPDDGWGIEMDNGSAQQQPVTEYAICAKVPLAYRHATSTVTPGHQKGMLATCPNGRFAFSGGEFNTGGYGNAHLNTLAPRLLTSTVGWQSFLDNHSGADLTQTAYAVCGKPLS